MPPARLVIVSDAHLGGAPPPAEEAFLAFLDAVPSLGDSLLINGDLFEFWFEYRRVVPRSGFRVAAALARLRTRLPITMTGGNHDRWGGDFWRTDLGIEFQADATTLKIGDRKVLALHGDGVTESRWSAQVLHFLTRHRATVALFGAIHPDLGFWLVDQLSRGLGHTGPDAPAIERAARQQVEWARRTVMADPSLGLVVMGHTHRAEVTDLGAGRQFLNPGAWFDGYRYAVATATSAHLAMFS